ncbi:MAG: HlyD family efflux transporter periplasmic adaptor subunit [Prevotella sp.]|nr:HlyD family efflux transporter periplasmic adaptor subunit [Prevotella sp.]
MKTKKMLPLLLLLCAACGNAEKEFDATGVFEATEVIVSAEQSGTLLTFQVNEGDELQQGHEIGLIDTTQLWLKVKQLGATKHVYQSQKPDTEKQIAATRQQLQKARQEQQRYQELVNDGAAPSKMLDDANNQVEVLQRQLEAQTSTLSTQNSTLDAQQAATDVQVSQLLDQLRRCHIAAPISGTVLEKYAEQGEFTATGKPLLKLADTRNMFLRAYVTSAQLKDLRIGQQVTVLADYGNAERKSYEGTISWISSRSEFTPKTILTDDERADQVYAVKIAVKNDGLIKIGMYGEVKFN